MSTDSRDDVTDLPAATNRLSVNNRRPVRSVYIPTQNPSEVVSPGDGTQQISAQIPEVLPRTDRTYDPNLLPPPRKPVPGNLSTLQMIRQRGIVFRNSYSRGTLLFGGDDKVGMFDVYTQAIFGFPKLPGVTFTPSIQTYFVDGPTVTDLPARLYAIQAEIRTLIPLKPDFILDLSVIPGLFTDFEQSGSDAFRIQARALAMYIWSPTSTFVFGVLYLDRFDIQMLPSGGWIYTPGPNWRFEVVFPRPKLGMRLSQTATYSRWAYMAGEFGGDKFAVERVDGSKDRLVYRDLRLIFGIEQKYVNGRSLFLELGYVFERRIEFASRRGEFEPGSTGMFRAGLIY